MNTCWKSLPRCVAWVLYLTWSKQLCSLGKRTTHISSLCPSLLLALPSSFSPVCLPSFSPSSSFLPLFLLLASYQAGFWNGQGADSQGPSHVAHVAVTSLVFFNWPVRPPCCLQLEVQTQSQRCGVICPRWPSKWVPEPDSSPSASGLPCSPPLLACSSLPALWPAASLGWLTPPSLGASFLPR